MLRQGVRTYGQIICDPSIQQAFQDGQYSMQAAFPLVLPMVVPPK